MKQYLYLTHNEKLSIKNNKVINQRMSDTLHAIVKKNVVMHHIFSRLQEIRGVPVPHKFISKQRAQFSMSSVKFTFDITHHLVAWWSQLAAYIVSCI